LGTSLPREDPTAIAVAIATASTSITPGFMVFMVCFPPEGS
jgi:hypothetical protein